MPERTTVEHHTPDTRETAAGADRIARLMADTLEDGLSRLQERPIRIRRMRRQVLQTSSSFRTERLHLFLGGGQTLRVFLKDLNPEHLIEKARVLRGSDLAPSRRELQMYQTVLSPQRFGTLHLYASRWEPERGIYWLFLEDGGDALLLEFLEMRLWTAAARWAARFHAATRLLPPAQTDFLPQRDHPYYQNCADRIRLLLPALPPQERELVGRGLACYVRQIDWLCSLPRCVIHGQFFGKNILLPKGRSTPAVAVIDWETAALGPGTFDLVSLTFGKWTKDQRRAMQTAYLEQYQAETEERIDEARFQQELAAVALYQSLEWLAWWGHHRSRSGHFASFMKELGSVLDDQLVAG